MNQCNRNSKLAEWQFFSRKKNDRKNTAHYWAYCNFFYGADLAAMNLEVKDKILAAAKVGGVKESMQAHLKRCPYLKR